VEEVIAAIAQAIEYEPAMVTAFVTALGLMFAHAGVTMAVKLKSGAFCWYKVPEFLKEDVAPYGLALMFMAVAGLFHAVALALYYAAAAGVAVEMIDRIQRKWKESLGMPLEEDNS